ncbi:hypothetical protein NKR23_g9984 [Pleurostoma richardsiae]|uniref:Mitochondrial carrier protein n=1 Tax=Pleurostoma richardsiae TaxID=41990 RepID=A0AA38REI5_9PEZI|nr:hypothetical protein NKR23_g9984 [Pleurostoma richardsiae]
MSADFWAGYVSGAVGIIIGNPLDILKVRLQAGTASHPIPTAAVSPSAPGSFRTKASALVTGTAAPILGYGALNALLFVSYNRSEALLDSALSTAPPGSPTSLWSTWLAGAIGGLATWAVSTPTELVKCRAQLAPAPGGASSWAVARDVWRAEGPRGFYFGGAVTALRDSVGYGFYFWSYELSTRWVAAASSSIGQQGEGSASAEAAKVLLCGGLAGIVTWASIFPLDVIKTRVQAQVFSAEPATLGEAGPLLGSGRGQKRLGAIEIAREAYREGGVRLFFRGLTVCSVRAFIVNAVQWAVYEWIMVELGQGRKRQNSIEAG